MNPLNQRQQDDGDTARLEGRATCIACKGKGKVLIEGRRVEPCGGCYGKGWIPALIDLLEAEQGPFIHCRHCGQYKRKAEGLSRCIYCAVTLGQDLQRDVQAHLKVIRPSISIFE